MIKTYHQENKRTLKRPFLFFCQVQYFFMSNSIVYLHWLQILISLVSTKHFIGLCRIVIFVVQLMKLDTIQRMNFLLKSSPPSTSLISSICTDVIASGNFCISLSAYELILCINSFEPTSTVLNSSFLGPNGIPRTRLASSSTIFIVSYLNLRLAFCTLNLYTRYSTSFIGINSFHIQRENGSKYNIPYCNFLFSFNF